MYDEDVANISQTQETIDTLNITPSEEIKNLPEYCSFLKFFLVEELALEDNYADLHYGKCSLIGKLKENEEGDFLLENIQLPNLASEYSLPEGSVALRLLRLNYFGAQLQHGRFCEVCGEVVLLDCQQPANNRIPHTSRWVNEQLLVLDQRKKESFLEKLRETHKPAIKLWLVDEVERAGELAERNLQIRMLSQRIKETNGSV